MKDLYEGDAIDIWGDEEMISINYMNVTISFLREHFEELAAAVRTALNEIKNEGYEQMSKKKRAELKSWLEDKPVKIGNKLVYTDLDLVCVIL